MQWHSGWGHSPAIIPGFLLTYASFIRDGTNLFYLYARYYDPQLRQRISSSALSCRLHGHDETGLYYLHADRLDSTMDTTNESGNTVADHGYYAYGRDRRGSELRTARRFTGQQSDASGLIYMNARYYDPQLGQFISPTALVPKESADGQDRRIAAALPPIRLSCPSALCRPLPIRGSVICLARLQRAKRP